MLPVQNMYVRTFFILVKVASFHFDFNQNITITSSHFASIDETTGSALLHKIMLCVNMEDIKDKTAQITFWIFSLNFQGRIPELSVLILS